MIRLGRKAGKNSLSKHPRTATYSAVSPVCSLKANETNGQKNHTHQRQEQEMHLTEAKGKKDFHDQEGVQGTLAGLPASRADPLSPLTYSPAEHNTSGSAYSLCSKLLAEDTEEERKSIVVPIQNGCK